ncbi:response regulator [Bacillus sp. FJAT-49732]|uniref:Response regulator n=1 Tax=Lederbergia citrisecunda TaxID=2833583 RepID=A0A942TPM4_9BACI|nr:response regulator [Lederbergia citrisecunda]MBS4202226.1 response regulator [Lederbergia citrisecunda]
MYRILLVDDESIERMALKKIITSWSDAIIEEAENGRMAIVKAAEFRPDIIFMDIKMPGIDGIEAAEEIKKMDNSVKVIMVTAFEAFEYARHAVRLGVNDYLLKPSSDQEIIDVLRKVTNEIAIERHHRNDQLNIREHYNKALSIIQSREITSLIVGNDVSESVDFEGNWISAYEKPSCVVVVEFGDTATGDEKQKISAFIKDQLSISDSQSFVGTIHLNQLPILIQLTDKENESIMSQSLRIGKNLIDKIQQKFARTNVKIGIGKCYDDIEEFVQSYHEALFALAKTNRPFTCTYFNHLLSDITSINQLFELEKTLLEHIFFGKIEESTNSFKKYFDELIVTSNGNIEVIKEKLNEFFVLLNRQMYEKKVDITYHLKYNQVKSMYQLQELVIDKIIQTTKMIHTLHFSENIDMVSKAKNYIEQHYEKSITLEDVAEVVQLSPHYFSKLFKELCGKSFIDYLTEVRVKHAKELMKQQEKSLKEICFQVGYKDPNYFSRVFKRVTGLSPSEYRNHQLKIG